MIGSGFSPADSLAILLTVARPSPEEQAAIQRLLRGGPASRRSESGPDSALNFPSFWKTVRHNDIAPLVFLSLRRLEALSLVPVWLAEKLEQRYRDIRARNQARLETCSRVFAAFARHQIPVVVLKGANFAERLYGDIGYKKMNDVDILVRFSDIGKIQELYHHLGLFPLELLEGKADEVEETKTHHLPAYVSRDFSLVVGTHWGLISRKSGISLDYDGIWKRVSPLTVGDQAVLSLAPEDNLHHLCVHFHYYKTGLKELGDFANLIRSLSPFPWASFHALVTAAGSQTASYRPLRLVKILYGLDVPEALLADLAGQADPFVVTDTDHLAGRRDLLTRSRSTYAAEIEKAYMAFTFEDRFSLKIRWLLTFWKRLLLPPRHVVHRISAARRGEHSLWGLYWLNLKRTAREIGKNFGLAIFGLLIVKSLAETGKALLHPEAKFEALEREHGITRDQLYRLMNSLD